MLYRPYGITISIDELWKDLSSSYSSRVDVWIRRLPSLQLPLVPSQWFTHWHLPGGEKWLSLGKLPNGYLLRFNELADFVISTNGHEIEYLSNSRIPSETVKHLLLDQVIPLVINLKGGEALHASAVLTADGVVAFGGPAGSGKSTLAGVLLKAGYPVMSDDCLSLTEKKGSVRAIPAYPGLRLWRDAKAYLFGDNGYNKSVAHYTDKLRMDIRGRPEIYRVKPRPLKVVYIIDHPSEKKRKTKIVIERRSGRDGFMELINYAFRLDITDHKMLTRQFHFFERVASKVSVRRLTFPRDFKLLPAVREAILNDLRDLDN